MTYVQKKLKNKIMTKRKKKRKNNRKTSTKEKRKIKRKKKLGTITLRIPYKISSSLKLCLLSKRALPKSVSPN